MKIVEILFGIFSNLLDIKLDIPAYQFNNPTLKFQNMLIYIHE